MPLKLCPTRPGSGIDKDRPDYTVYTGEWNIGRIYETAAVPTVEDFAGPVTHHAILPLPRFLYPRCGVPSRGEFPGEWKSAFAGRNFEPNLKWGRHNE
jgi:hypothetical protein